MEYYAKYAMGGTFHMRHFASEKALDEWLSSCFTSLEALGAKLVLCGQRRKND